MNSAPSGLNLIASTPSSSAERGMAGFPPGSQNGNQAIDFNSLFSQILASPEGLSRLRELLPEEQMAQFEALLEDGNGLPLSADLAAISELQGNPALVQWMMQLIEGGAAGQSLAATSDPGRAAISMADFRAMLLRQGAAGEGGNGAQSGGRSDTLKADVQAAILQSQEEGLAELPQQVRSMLLKGDSLSGLSQVQATSGATPFSSLMMGVDSLASSRAGQMTPPPMGVPMGERGWDNVLGNRIMWMVGKQMHQASLQVTPRHLGPIDIQVTVQNDLTHVSFTAQNALTREAIEAAIPRLRDMFAENNMQLVNVDVGQRESGTPNQGTNFAGHGTGQGGHSAGGTPGGEMVGDGSPSSATELRISSGLVDDYA